MIYEMPYNKNIQGKLPATPTQQEFNRFLAMVRQALIDRGYVLGPAGVYVGPTGGTIMVDADRDPAFDWMNASLPNSTPKEDSDKTKLDQALALIAKLDAGMVPTAVEVRQSLAFLLRAELESRGINVP